MATAAPPQIALSCAVSDRAIAHDLAQALRASGYRVAPIEMGPAQVTETYGAPGAVIVVWSAASAASKWVSQEAAQALARGALVEVALQPVRGDAPSAPLAPISFEGWDGAQGPAAQQNPAMKELRKRLRPLIGGPRGALNVTQATPWALGGAVVVASVVAIGMSLATRAPSNAAQIQPIKPIVATSGVNSPAISQPKDLRQATPLKTAAQRADAAGGPLELVPLETGASEDRDKGYSREDIAAIRARRKAAREKAAAPPPADEAPIEGPPL
jgi:hypothetical protein